MRLIIGDRFDITYVIPLSSPPLFPLSLSVLLSLDARYKGLLRGGVLEGEDNVLGGALKRGLESVIKKSV